MSTFIKQMFPLMCVLQVVGVVPIVKWTGAKTLAVRKLWRLYSYSVLIGITGSTAYAVRLLVSTNTAQAVNYRHADFINQCIELCLCMLSYTITVAANVFNSRTHLNILNETLEVDREISKRFGRILSQSIGPFFALSLLCTMSYPWTCFVFYMSKSTVQFFYVYFFECSICLPFAVYLSAIMFVLHRRFQLLNEVIESVTSSQRFEPIKVDQIAFLLEIYTKILGIQTQVNEVSGVPLIVIMGQAFYVITSDTYTVFLELSKGQESVRVDQVHACLIEILVEFTVMGLLSVICNDFFEEVKKTSHIFARFNELSNESRTVVSSPKRSIPDKRIPLTDLIERQSQSNFA